MTFRQTTPLPGLTAASRRAAWSLQPRHVLCQPQSPCSPWRFAARRTGGRCTPGSIPCRTNTRSTPTGRPAGAAVDADVGPPRRRVPRTRRTSLTRLVRRRRCKGTGTIWCSILDPAPEREDVPRAAGTGWTQRSGASIDRAGGRRLQAALRPTAWRSAVLPTRPGRRSATSADGPLGTKDYRNFAGGGRAAGRHPLDAARMSYAYGFGLTARVAMKAAYLATAGSDSGSRLQRRRQGRRRQAHLRPAAGRPGRAATRCGYYLAISPIYVVARQRRETLGAASRTRRFDATEALSRQLHRRWTRATTS